MAGNPLVGMFKIKELRERVLFTLAMLFVFRLGAVIPLPGIDAVALKAHFQAQTQGSNAIVDYLDFFAGGAFSRFSVFMLGIMPYITMSIMMQLFLIIFPSLKKLSEEEGGRKKIQQYQRVGTILVCLVQSYGTTLYAASVPGLITISRLSFTLIAMLTVTTGTMFLMWIGEQITKRGIGNGTSLLIFAGIVARLPTAVIELVEKVQDRTLNPVYVVLVFAMFVAIVALVVFEQQGQRKIPVHYAKRVVGRKMYEGGSTYIPFKINPSGVIPVIFASSILTFPMQLAQTFGKNIGWLARVANFLSPNGWAYHIFYVLLIIFFAYFYTQVTLNPIEIAKQIRENGGSIPGIRTEKIEQYLVGILNRIVFPGSLYLALIAILPTLIQRIFNFPASISYLLGGTSLLILVGVDLDTMSQVEALLKMHHFEGLTKKGKIRSRNL